MREMSSSDGLGELLRFGMAYASSGLGLWRDLFRAGVFAAEDAARDAFGENRVPTNLQDWLRAFTRGATTYGTEMATVLPRAVDRLSRQVDHGPRWPFVTGPRIGSAPPLRKTRVIDGAPVVLPVRIIDASQAFAFYFVSAARAQKHLEERTQPFRVVDVGRGRTPVAIFGVDYRETDLGVYKEIGVGLFVRPRDHPSEMPGTLFASLTVNDKFNLIRASELWGYSKTLAPAMQLRYSSTSAHFAVDGDDSHALSITFPRFGSGRSTEIPCYTWGVGKDDAGVAAPFKTLISRSAIGEGMQFSGNVELQLGDGTQTRCVCKLGPFGKQACVCLMLRDLGLPKPPAANTWSEHMWASCMEAVVCATKEGQIT
jgi:Acetoacetate decarboxylase (ADC)